MFQFTNYKAAPNEDATNQRRGLMTAKMVQALEAIVAKLDEGVSSTTADANGWRRHRHLNGKSVWHKAFIGLTLPAAVATPIINGAPLPVGIANMANLNVITDGRTAANSFRFLVRPQGGDASTTLTVGVGTFNGTNLDTHGSTTIDIFVELRERT